MNSITLGTTGAGTDYPVHDPPKDTPFGLNAFCTYTGGARYGQGRFLMRRADYNSLKGDAGTSGAAVLKMKDGSNTLQFNVFVAGAVTHSLAIGGGSAALSVDASIGTDMLEVVVFDLRAKRLTPVTKAYNVQKDGFSVDSTGKPDFYSTTLLSTSTQWPWTSVFRDVGFPSTSTVSAAPSWYPRNLIYDGIAQGRVYDELASRLGWIIGWDYSADKYTLWKPGDTNAGNAALLDLTHLVSGGTTQRNDARLPGNFQVTFRGVSADSPDNPYATRSYTKTITNAAGDPAVTQALFVGDYVAVNQGGTWANQADLDTVATDVAAREFALMNNTVGEYEFSGLRNVQLDGQVRGICWVSDRKGARTIVRYNNDEDFSPLRDFQRRTEALSNMLVVGGGATMVGLTLGGTRLVWGSGTLFGGVANPITIGSSTEGPDDPHSTLYTISDFTGQKKSGQISRSDGKAVEVWHVIDVNYHEDGLQKLQMYKLKITYDTNMMPAIIGPLVGPINIDTPQPCSSTTTVNGGTP